MVDSPRIFATTIDHPHQYLPTTPSAVIMKLVIAVYFLLAAAESAWSDRGRRQS